MNQDNQVSTVTITLSLIALLISILGLIRDFFNLNSETLTFPLFLNERPIFIILFLIIISFIVGFIFKWNLSFKGRPRSKVLKIFNSFLKVFTLLVVITICIFCIKKHFDYRKTLKKELAQIKKNMVYVQSGKFSMGCIRQNNPACDKDEFPIKEISIKSFYISKYEVTQKQWRVIMGKDLDKCEFNQCDDCPVNGVSWDDTQSFIKKLNEKTSLPYRLPTSSEWEFAARGGIKSKYFIYAGSDTLSHVAWYSNNSNGTIEQVGHSSLKPNELGLYDMSGNVWEWVEDCSHTNYNTHPSDGSAFLKQGCSRKAVRGGSFNDTKDGCRVSNHFQYLKNKGFYTNGFRLVRNLEVKK